MDILIGKRCDLLLWLFIVRKVLLVLLPVGTRGARHGGDAGAAQELSQQKEEPRIYYQAGEKKQRRQAVKTGRER